MPKWVQGRLVQGGQWYGTAVVLGHVGSNLVRAHRKQNLRAAPEQLRPATNEEKQLLNTSGAELMGIKDLIEGGAFKSQQYIDLTSQSYPLEQPQSTDNHNQHITPSSNLSSVNHHLPETPAGTSFEPKPPDVFKPPLVTPESPQMWKFQTATCRLLMCLK
jgi:hypothetical protein